MRIIDADALIEKWYEVNNIGPEDRGARFIGYTEIPRFINNAPTVQPTGDLISRADAVKAIRKCKFESVMPSDWYRGMECAQDIVEELPSAEADWIPVSERLPSEGGDYLCTIPLDAEENYTEVLMFHKGRFYEDDAEWGATYHDDVLAWMPLPKPYREDGEV